MLDDDVPMEAGFVTCLLEHSNLYSCVVRAVLFFFIVDDLD